ncbi:maleylpyruvate isomerase N-terminal domain-containing protein [Lentzea terrae]|uniref:maleylpyruvate isomerase N-terminal domain-containing protein n=1 Tax=Lentzea terrae TaxID=2200761 RepID=UPI000DD3FB49|nr:maleylpyruvate isomerase N-terminal domain-containing protein [Lentzea terrae]
MNWPDLLDAAADDCVRILSTLPEDGFSRRANGLEWSCRATLDHVVEGLLGYTALLTTRAEHRWTSLLGTLRPGLPLEHCLEGVKTTATLLSRAVAASPDARAWHPWGTSDAAGFAAMGITELTMHTHDITQAFGVEWRPERCAPVVERLFPDAPQHPDPVALLLWCTGRGELPGVRRRVQWQWSHALLEEVV